MVVGITALILLMSAGIVTAELNGIIHPQDVSYLILEPNTSISPSNPVRISAFVNDENIESVVVGIVDINNLLSDNMILFGAVINKSGRSGMYSFVSWPANSLSIKSDNVKEIVTVFLLDQFPESRNYWFVQGWFKKNATTKEQEAFLWFNTTTGNLYQITDNGSFTPLAIENGISFFTVSKFKFLQGWDKPPNPVEGATFTLYNSEKNNPHLVRIDVPSGTYRIFIHVVDKDGSNYGEYKDIITGETDILLYYRGLGNYPNVVETTDLLKAADDWSNNIAPPGFASPITTQQLLSLADEWSRN